MLSWKKHSLPKREKSDKADRLFEIALLLVTVLSASIFQYLSSRYSFDTVLTNAQKLSDLSFAFKELTIPIIILILLWLLKELIFGRSVFSSSLKGTVKEFCWAFLGIFLAMEILSVVFLGFITNPSQVSTTGHDIMLALAFVSTFVTTWKYSEWKYSEYISVKAKSKTNWLKRFGFVFGEHCLVFVASYLIFFAVIQISALPAPI